MNARYFGLAVALSLVAGGSLGCTSTAPQTEARKTTLHDETQTALKSMKASDPTLDAALSGAAGYAMFPDATKAGFLFGGAYGRGEVYQNGKFIGYSTINQGTVGAQIGAMNYSLLLVFENQAALDKFTRGEWSPAANASAIALKAGAAAATKFTNGTFMLIDTRGGAMAEATLGGQKFNFQSATDPNMDANAAQNASGPNAR